MARIKGFTVTLERDTKEEDFQRVQEAVEMIKGVIHVEPSLVTGNDHINRTRIKIDVTRNIMKLVDETE